MNKILFLIHLTFVFCSFVSSIVNRKNLPGYFKYFTILTGVTFFIESIGFYFIFYSTGPRQYLYHLYVPVLYSLVAFIYSKAIGTAWKKKVIAWSIPAFWLLAVYFSVFIQKVNVVNTYTTMIVSILIVMLSLSYYYELLQKEGAQSLVRDPLFWISTANLIFYAGVFLLMGSLNYLMKEMPVLSKKLMVINYFLNYILYSFYSIGFLCTTQNRKSWL